MKLKTYHVYDPKTQTLNGLTKDESELIDLLHISPIIKFKRIINDYFKTVQDYSLALERLDEIFMMYYNSCSDPTTVTLFRNKRKELESIFEILDQLSNKNDSLNSSPSNSPLKRNDKILVDNFETLLFDNGKLLMPYLKEKFTMASTQNLVNMVKALIEINSLPSSVLTNQALLHRCLTATFGEFGKYQSLNTSISSSENADRKEIIKSLGAVFQSEVKKALDEQQKDNSSNI